MPIEIEAPDGSIVEFPDGTPDETIIGVMQENFGSDEERPVIGLEQTEPVAALSTAPEEEAQGVGLSPLLEQGATAFLSDEITGASRAVGQIGRNLIAGEGLTQGVGEAFDRGVDETRAQIEQSLEENPIAGRVVEGVGALATGPGRLLASAGNTLLGRITAAAAEGGILGGLFGFGGAEGSVVQRIPEAAQGAAIGASIGGAVPVAVKGAELASRPIRTAVGALRSQANAEVKVVEALAKDNVTPAQARASLARAQRAQVPEALTDVAGRNTQRLARSARTTTGPGSEKIDAFLITRQLEQPDRVLNTIRRTLGGDDVFKVADDIVAERSALANRMYGEAFETAGKANVRPVINGIQEQIKTTAGRTKSELKSIMGELFQEPKRTAAKSIGTKKRAPRKIPKTDVEALHGVKTELDDMIANAVKGERNNQVRVLTNVQNSLLKALDAASPEYRSARQVFSSLSESVDALQAGQKFLQKDSRVTTASLEKMTGGEKEMFRLGASEAIANKINSAKDGAGIARRIFGNKTQRAQLEAVFPDKRLFREFEATMLREGRTTQTNQFVRGGSQTIDKAEELIDSQSGAVVQDILRGDPVSALSRTAGTAINAAQGITPKTADAIADILTSTDPAVINTIMRALEARAASVAATNRGVNAAIGATTREGVAAAN